MAQFLQELEQDPFAPDEFVERLAWRATGSTNINKSASDNAKGDFDAESLYKCFEETIGELKILHDIQQKKFERIESFVKEEEKKNWQIITELQEKNKRTYKSFQELDECISSVATKVVHFGDQLDMVNVPRARAVEAQKLMNHFAEFLTPGPVISEVFTDKSQLEQAADVIQKLHVIAQELPPGKFEKAKQGIATKYDEIERNLIEDFVKAHRINDRARMKELVAILSHFKGYSECIDAFIEQSQLGSFGARDIFAEIYPLCSKNNVIMREVFSNPEQVMAKYVLNIYQGILMEHIHLRLADTSNSEVFLKHLHDLYSKTNKLSTELSAFDMGSDQTFLTKLTKNIFKRYLQADSYIKLETQCLKDKLENILQRYYDSLKHQKKPLPTGSLADFRRNIQLSIGVKGNININLGGGSDPIGEETFLSEEVALNLLQESKVALRRCSLLSRVTDKPADAEKILDLLINYLCVEHIDYALELGIQNIPSSEPKTQPELYFLDTARQANAIIHIMDRQFTEMLLPLTASTPKHSECLEKKKFVFEHVEQKLDSALDKVLLAVIGWIKVILQNDQKKTDFRPEEMIMANITNACKKVVNFINSVVAKIKDSIDGKNVEFVLLELGTRFHRVIYDHMQQFTYCSVGGMCAIFDVNEYRKCIQQCNSPVLNNLFDLLHAVCNLLVVDPKNLRKACTGDQLTVLDKSVLHSFIQLRADYKTEKLGLQFK